MTVCASCGIIINDNEYFCSECSNKTSSITTNVNTPKKSSIFWYLVPIIFGIIGGGGAYYWLRKSDPKKAKYCLLIGLGITIIWFANGGSDSNSPIIEKNNEVDLEAEKLRIEQEKIVREEKAQLQRQALLDRQEESRIEQMKQLPESCYGVNSIEEGLYSTSEKCLELIDERIFEFCLSENNNDETKAYGCMGQAYTLMDRNCSDSELSYYKVCMMSELKYVYQNLIPK